ncbi:MAG TPA: CPBP family intramembrane metalloprotease domain-containing protein [Anaerolineae bacterium]|nr:CPBP family intramembrane metalloprotease domain-containing protein [Anaerolineae bacterium]HRJ59145.1 CPBP family intramembrane metalloprotease [Anaerolineales bacterium]
MNLSLPFFNPADGRLRAGWRLLAQQLVLVFALLVLEDFLTTPLKPSLSQNGLWILEAVVGCIAFGVSVWLAGRWFDKRPFADFGFHLSRRWWSQLGFGMALGAGFIAVIFLTEWTLGYVHIVQFGVTVEPGASLAWALTALFIHYIGIAFTEEILTRGYVLRNLLEGFKLPKQNWSGALAVLVSSVIFALPHAGNPNATPLGIAILVLFGIFCAVAVVLTHELAIPLGFHLTWNFFQGNVFGFPVSGWELRGGTLLFIEQSGPAWLTGDAFGPEAGVVGLAAILLGILILFLTFNPTHNFSLEH